MREFLLDIKVKGKKLFTTTEYGVGKYSKDTLVIVRSLQKIVDCK